MAVDSGDGDGIAQAQVVELVDVRVGGTHLVHLVHCQHNRLPGAQEHIGHLLVRGGEAGLDIAEENDDRGVLDGDLRLLAHKGQDLAVGTRLDAAGVHDVKGTSAPLRLGVEPVAGDAGGVLNDGQAFAHQLIEQHGLSHIRASNDGDQRFHWRHILSMILLTGYSGNTPPPAGGQSRCAPPAGRRWHPPDRSRSPRPGG